MKQLITLLVLFLFGTFAYAAPGGGKPHKVTEYDYHDYTNSDIQKKTFIRYQNGGVEFEVDWVFDRVSTPGQVKRHEIKKNSEGYITRHAINVFAPMPDSYEWLAFNLCNIQPDQTEPGPCDSPSTNIYSPPISSLTSAMVPGIAWGSAGAINDEETYFTYKFEVVAIEEVTVPYGTFSDCLKLHKQRHYGSSMSTDVLWVCPNMGPVKRIEGGKAIMVLDSFE